jgi:pimeloyl-ACP methyl ester carboxylesterase
MYPGKESRMTAQGFFHGVNMRSVEAEHPRGVLFHIHGLGESGLCLEYIMTHPLLSGFTHFAPDLPGYGKSPWPAEPLRIADLAEAAAQWIRLCTPGRVILLGHSLGGVIGTVLCERHPELVSLFIDVEGNVSAEDCTFSCRIAGYTLEDFLAFGFERFSSDIYLRGVEEKSLRYYFASMRMCDPRQIHLNSVELIDLSAPEDLGMRLARLEAPAHYFWGDPRGTQAHSRGLLEAAGIPLTGIHDAGHWPFVDQPDQFAKKLLAILDATIP